MRIYIYRCRSEQVSTVHIVPKCLILAHSHFLFSITGSNARRLSCGDQRWARRESVSISFALTCDRWATGKKIRKSEVDMVRGRVEVEGEGRFTAEVLSEYMG